MKGGIVYRRVGQGDERGEKGEWMQTPGGPDYGVSLSSSFSLSYPSFSPCPCPSFSARRAK